MIYIDIIYIQCKVTKVTVYSTVFNSWRFSRSPDPFIWGGQLYTCGKPDGYAPATQVHKGNSSPQGELTQLGMICTIKRDFYQETSQGIIDIIKLYTVLSNTSNIKHHETSENCSLATGIPNQPLCAWSRPIAVATWMTCAWASSTVPYAQVVFWVWKSTIWQKQVKHL